MASAAYMTRKSILGHISKQANKQREDRERVEGLGSKVYCVINLYNLVRILVISCSATGATPESPGGDKRFPRPKVTQRTSGVWGKGEKAKPD